MAKPRVFISSTYYDLRYLRTSLESFVENLGYEAVLSEKGRIAYDPDLPLDESCYRDASRADMFVLVIGGRYGSPSSEEQITTTPKFYERYDSITKKEYEAAIARDIPTYILVDKSVMTEFETFKKNRGREETEYAHVDSVNIFHLLEDILGRKRNNPTHHFERSSEIEDWLKEQWAGLFHEFIGRRSEQKQLASLSDRVDELSFINSSLQRYLEAIVSKVSTEKEAEILIKSEKEKIEEANRLREFFDLDLIVDLYAFYGIGKKEIQEIFTLADSIENLANQIHLATGGQIDKQIAINQWKNNYKAIDEINMARKLLGKPSLKLQKSSVKTSPQRSA